MSPRRQPTDEGTSAPINVSPEKRVSLPIVMLVSIVGIAISATIGWTALQADVKAAGTLAVDANTIAKQHEDRLRALERAQIQIAEMARDVEWIKRRMEEERRGGRE